MEKSAAITNSKNIKPLGGGKKQIFEVVILFKMLYYLKCNQKFVYAQKHNGPYKERKNSQKKLFLRKPQTVNLLDEDLKLF